LKIQRPIDLTTEIVSEVRRADLRREGQRPPGCIRLSPPSGGSPNTDWRHADFEIGGKLQSWRAQAGESSALKAFSVRRRIHRRDMVAIIVQQFDTTLHVQPTLLVFLEGRRWLRAVNVDGTMLTRMVDLHYSVSQRFISSQSRDNFHRVVQHLPDHSGANGSRWNPSHHHRDGSE
jgi:hypothetical protein